MKSLNLVAIILIILITAAVVFIKFITNYSTSAIITNTNGGSFLNNLNSSQTLAPPVNITYLGSSSWLGNFTENVQRNGNSSRIKIITKNSADGNTIVSIVNNKGMLSSCITTNVNYPKIQNVTSCYSHSRYIGYVGPSGSLSVVPFSNNLFSQLNFNYTGNSTVADQQCKIVKAAGAAAVSASGTFGLYINLTSCISTTYQEPLNYSESDGGQGSTPSISLHAISVNQNIPENFTRLPATAINYTIYESEQTSCTDESRFLCFNPMLSIGGQLSLQIGENFTPNMYNVKSICIIGTAPIKINATNLAVNDFVNQANLNNYQVLGTNPINCYTGNGTLVTGLQFGKQYNLTLIFNYTTLSPTPNSLGNPWRSNEAAAIIAYAT